MPGSANDIFGVVEYNQTMSITLPIMQLSTLRLTLSPPTPEDGTGETASDTIFLKQELFTALFIRCDSNGQPFVDKASGTSWKDQQWTSPGAPPRHQHVGHGRDRHRQHRRLGAVFSSRPGLTNITRPTVVYAHLVSIEGVKDLKRWPINDPAAAASQVLRATVSVLLVIHPSPS